MRVKRKIVPVVEVTVEESDGARLFHKVYELDKDLSEFDLRSKGREFHADLQSLVDRAVRMAVESFID